MPETHPAIEENALKYKKILIPEKTNMDRYIHRANLAPGNGNTRPDREEE
jgi:hypothetical protein